MSQTHVVPCKEAAPGFDVKVVECEITDAAERWRELVRYLLEVDAAQ